jgi:hypothetical protein
MSESKADAVEGYTQKGVLLEKLMENQGKMGACNSLKFTVLEDRNLRNKRVQLLRS